MKRATRQKKPAPVKAASPASSTSGPRIYNLFPLLAGRVDQWGAHLPRIARMGFDWVYLNPFHQSGFSGSLYAIQNHYAVDRRFLDDPSKGDEALAGFIRAAKADGLRVMMDLVINHTAFDAKLAADRPDLYHRAPDGSLLRPSVADPDDPSKVTVWGDLAELNYSEPRLQAELIEHWDAYLAHHQTLGFSGFRCDAAYMVPAEVWRALIARAKARDAGAVFAAETLGCTPGQAMETAAAGFDYLFNSFAWWDLKSDWFIEQSERLRLAAGSIAFAENHDMPRLAASHAGDDPTAISRRLGFHYALSSLVSNGVLMPSGYEHALVAPLHVVETRPKDWEKTGVDISETVAAWNALRARLAPLNANGALSRLSAPGADHLALLRLGGGHAVSAEEAVLVLANPTEAELGLDPGSFLAGAGGLFAFEDVTPNATPVALAPGVAIELGPLSLRVFLGRQSAGVAPRSTEPHGEGRVVIERVLPELDGGLYPVKRVVGDMLAVTADIFTDGHDKILADLLVRAADEGEWTRYPMHFVDNDRWAGAAPLMRNTRYVYTVEAWRDVYASWRDEVTKKRAAGLVLDLEATEGVHIVEGAVDAARGEDKAALQILLERLTESDWQERIAILIDEKRAGLVARYGERRNVSRYPRELEVSVDRLAARFSAWYELFPRSASDDASRHGTFDDVIAKLPYVRDMGFDVLYFPPIHPIGVKNRKGKNNSLKAEPGDPGSVYAIGGVEGGHTATHPQLGTIEDFRRLVAASHAHGLEIALDFAIQCSPDHPWIKEHPEWFEWRPDGTLKFAENPPKKYEDIVNVHFYGESLPSLWYALRDAILFWAGEGVRIFRVDNPHTKPVPFWRWCIAEVNARYPDVLFLAEAFTRPKMMRQLAKAGFQQSYTYFTWRNTKAELTEYMTELAHGEMGEYYRPNFFANTPDINPYYLQTSGRPGFIVRATLAATLSSVYGLYSGFELAEGTPIAGKEEYLDSEKYEVRAWDWGRRSNIREHVTRLNRIRRGNPALWDFRNVLFLNAWNDNILAYAKLTPSRDNVLVFLVNLDPHHVQEASYEIPLWEFGLPDHASVEAEELIEDAQFTLHGKVQRIRLDPATKPVAIFRLTPPSA